MTSSSSTSMFKGAGMISAQDLLQLVKDCGKSAFLRTKCCSSFMRTVKWKQRFVILANNEIYIYADEISQKPNACIPLLGYNQVQRYNVNEKFPWSFTVSAAVASVKPHVFSCATEIERRQWMRKIKDHLYKANGIERPFTEELDHLASGMELEYLDLEEAIFQSDIVKSDKDRHESGDFESVDINDSDSEEDIPTIKNPTRKASIGSHKGVRVLPSLPGESPCSPPPRYSTVMHPYMNDSIPVTPSSVSSTMSLSEACMITDKALIKNRDMCRSMIQEKTRVGAYLIRQSRSDDNLVLVVLANDGEVKEFRLEECNDLYRLNSKTGGAEYVSLDDLLYHFSHIACLPNTSMFLTHGIHDCVDDSLYQEMA